MTDQTDFVANPTAFMNKHVLVPMFAGPMDPDFVAPPGGSGPQRVRVVEIAGASLLNPPQGAASKVFRFSLDLAGVPPGDILDIFWLPYRPNEFRWGVLDSTHQYMFTAAMNGCTMGFGSQSGDGSCLVTHANNVAIGTAQGPAAQQQAQLDQVGGFFSGLGSYTVLEPAGYRQDSGGDLSWTATNFGISDGANWQFWTHKYRQRSDVIASRQFFHGGAVTQAIPIPPI